MFKCSQCNKIVTKKSPGIQCDKCSKWTHGECAAISEEQLNVLNSTDFVDWKCQLKRNNLCKFVWCNNGVILARKHETNKIHHIRSSNDEERLVKLFNTK
ncbi:unnamed protein product [Parnassius mnemosyne]|uniref:FP protein C-terminal domain-containing protein n=1 Tax=Parnassius mnemosyne TaxID=213953 RepID=A0AAV1K8B6_9NEOP